VASFNSTALAASSSSSKVQHKADGKALDEEQKLLDAGQTSECEAKLVEVLHGDPANLAARKLHAESLYRLGRYHFAADEIDFVLKQQPQDAGSLLLSGKIYQSLHKPALAVESYKKFLALNHDDQLNQQYSALVTVLESEAKNAAAATTSTRKDAGDYLNAVTIPGMPKWKNPSSISVFIRDGKNVAGYRPEFEESLRQAFDDWHNSTNGKIGFVFVPDQANAKMTVTWSSDLHAPQFTGEAGLAKYTTGAEGYNTAEILLLTQDPFKDGPVGHNAIYNICLHEIGHALGLQGHSPHEDDIMYPSLSSQQGLSARDINTMLALYGDRQATTVILVDKDEWGRPLPPTVVAERLGREGMNLLSTNQFPQAIAKLEEALKLEVKTPYAKENLAVALNNLAIAKETPDDKKIELLHQALFWNPKLDGARANLNNYLQSLGHDPKSFTERVKLAEQCGAKHDAKGAVVEYTEALSIKDDSAVRIKLSQLQKNLPHF
jgi:predicted Zn-dependent protease